MKFLKEFGISDDVIENMKERYDSSLIDLFICDEYNASEVIEYFQSIGIEVIDKLLLTRIEIFSIDVEDIKESFNRFNVEELVNKINMDISYINCL